MRKTFISALIAATLFAGSTPSHALHSLDKYVNSTNLASPGLLIMNPADGTVIAKNSPDSLRIPASVLKLVSTAAALHFVGADKTYVTSIHSTDKSNTYVLRGRLDPWLTSNLTLAKKNGQKFFLLS